MFKFEFECSEKAIGLYEEYSKTPRNLAHGSLARLGKALIIKQKQLSEEPPKFKVKMNEK